MLNKIPAALYYGVLVLASVAIVFFSYSIGRATSPGPYLPAEDSFDYRNHHCYPIYNGTNDSGPAKVFGDN